MSGPGPAWPSDTVMGEAAALHDDWPDPAWRGHRCVALRHVQGRPAIVLGSTQPEPPASPRPYGVVRRRTGGGAVWVAPGEQVWIDLWIAPADPLWDDDVVRSARWVGDTWRRALISLGTPEHDVAVHGTGLDRTARASLVCFAGTGPGEVSVDGKKVVGIAQRRTRHGAWFQCVAPLQWDPGPILNALGRLGLLDVGVAGAAEWDLTGVARGLRSVVGEQWARAAGTSLVHACEAAVLRALPDGGPGRDVTAE